MRRETLCRWSSGEGGQNWSGHRDARQGANDSPQRVGISQRTTGRVLTFVPLEERVDILPQPNDGGLAHRIIRLATEILFNALISMVRPVLLLG